MILALETSCDDTCAAVVMWRTPATLRGSLDDVPNASPV